MTLLLNVSVFQMSYKFPISVRHHDLNQNFIIFFFNSLISYLTRSSTFLKSHETVHSKELKYNCEKCDKAFAWKDSLRRHNIAIHSDERRHVCDICGSSFKDQSAMTKHKMRHTGQKNHACEVCGKLFMFKYQVTEHFRVHTGVKKFGCGMCDQRFTTKFSALKHQNKQHPHHVPVVFI